MTPAATEKFTNDSEHSLERRVGDFTDLVDKIDGLTDQKKVLWREIYQNAITDRQNAYEMFAKLRTIMGEKTTEHAVHGRSAAAYIERMNKANDQLLKLVEQVAHAEELYKAGVETPEDMYAQIGST